MEDNHAARLEVCYTIFYKYFRVTVLWQIGSGDAVKLWIQLKFFRVVKNKRDIVKRIWILLGYIEITFGDVNANNLCAGKFFRNFPGKDASATCEIQERTSVRNLFQYLSLPVSIIALRAIRNNAIIRCACLTKKFRYEIFCRFCQHYISRTK